MGGAGENFQKFLREWLKKVENFGGISICENTLFSSYKLIFRPFGTKKKWKWKMTFADSPPHLKWNSPLFFNPSLIIRFFESLLTLYVVESKIYVKWL